jgi:hypothetical protein
MRRTRMMLVAAAATLALSASGTGIAHAQTEDPGLAEQCASYNWIEWLLIHHECHGHTGDGPYYPSMLSWF